MFRKVLLRSGVLPFPRNGFIIKRRNSKQSFSQQAKGVDIRERLMTLSQSGQKQLSELPLHSDDGIPKLEDLDKKQPSTFEDLAHVCTPLWKLSYNEQLSMKNQNNLELMERLTAKLKPNRSTNSLICQLLDTVPSPVEKFYRNKDEFHIRYSHSGEPVIGLCVGKAANGTLECLKSDGLVNMKPIHSEVASHLQQYVAQSKWKICEHFKDGGKWRNLIVRSNKENHLMIIAVIHPQDLGQTEIHEEMLRMKDYMLGCSISGNLKSIYYQACPHTRCTAEQSPFVLVHGETHLYEEIGQQRFRISPESFFQINTDGAGVLYDIVARELKPNRMSTVLDLCCGTGTQGIMVANKCRGVVGIELSQSAVLDAKFNAQLNGIHNAEFYSGRVETLFRQVLDTLLTTPEISAIINPSRGGTADNVIQLLRENERVRRLVYVSCKPDGPALKNFYMLCQRENKRIKGKPFQLTKATPVDMFPQTKHCELVLTFQR